MNAASRTASLGAVALGAVLTSAAGCALPDFFSRTPPTPIAQMTEEANPSADLTVTALPVYRLVTSPALADAPSRLLVIQVRLSSAGGGALSVTPENVALVLPNGERGRVFDRGRAMELVRRSTLADADLSYLRRDGDHLPGGLSEEARSPLSDMVVSNLLTEGAFTSEQAMQGFVVVDTGVPLVSLDGASIEAVAYRLRDAAPARGAYQFAVPPATAEAH